MTQVPSKQPLLHADFIEDVNTKIQKFVESCTIVTLGPAFSTMCREDASSHLILHRMKKKFGFVPPEGKDDRRMRSIENMVAYDFGLDLDFEHTLRCDSLFGLVDPLVKRQLYQARNLFNEVISNYRPSYNAVRFPSGETLVSSGGDVSLYAKLRDIEQWTVTADCFDLFAKLCYNTPGLKFAARRHMAMSQYKLQVTKGDYDRVLAACEGKRHKAAFLCFKWKLRHIVTFVIGAKVTTVDKDMEIDRVIECEAFLNMICQLWIDDENKNLIKTSFGIDLASSQLLHKLLINDQENATIDFENASNSTVHSVVKWFACNSGKESRWYKDIKASRCGLVELPDGDIHSLAMLSPMGNGYTFSVMTLLILCVARSMDSESYVFGDDLIIDNLVAQQCIETLKYIGYKTNMKKTFVDSTFRESCGGFIYQHEYLTSFDFSWAEDAVDAVVLCNKVWVLSFNSPPLLAQRLRELHRSLLEKAPDSLLRVSPKVSEWAQRCITSELQHWRTMQQLEDRAGFKHVGKTICSTLHGDPILTSVPSLHDGLWAAKTYVLRVKKANELLATKHNALVARIAESTNVPKSNIHICMYLKLTKENRVYRFTDRVTRKPGRPMKFYDNVSRLMSWFYIFTGKVTAPAVRDTVVKSEWSYDFIP